MKVCEIQAFIRDFGPAIAWFVAAVGWLVSGFQATKRERRKEVRDEIAEVSELIASILKDLSEYHPLASTDPQASLLVYKIQSAFHRLDARIALLGLRKTVFRRSLLALDPVISASTAFFDDTTGGQFGSVGKPVYTSVEVADHLHRQSCLGYRIASELHEAFLKRFG